MKNKIIFFFLFFFFFSSSTNAQKNNNDITNFDLFVNRVDSLMSMDSLELVLSEIQLFTKEGKTLSDFQKIKIDSFSRIANISFAKNLQLEGQYEKAIQHYKDALLFFEKTDSTTQVELGKLYKNLGTVHLELLNFKAAKNYTEKALALFLKTVGEYNSNTLFAYYNMGTVFRYEGDFAQSYDYMAKALRVANNLYPSDHPAIATILELQAHNDLKLKRAEEAIKKIKIAQQIRLEKRPVDPFRLARSYNVWGALYSELERYPEALDNYQKALNLMQTNKDDDPIELASTFGHIGIAYSNLGDFKKANEYMAQAYQLSSDAIGEQHPEPAGHLTEWAFINLLEHKYNLAEQRFDKAAIDFGYEHNSDLPYENISDYAYFLDVLIGKGTAILERGKIDNNKNTLMNAASVFEQASDVLSILKTNFNDPFSLLGNIDLYYELFEKLIDTRLRIYEITKDEQYLQQAVAASEESKAYLLLENFRTINARKFSGIPDSLLAKEKQLKIEYEQLQEAHFEASQEEKLNQKLLSELDEKMFKTKQALNDLINYFKKNHDKYFKLKYKKQKLDFSKIQNSLATEEALVEYFVGDSSLYLFRISPKKIDYKKLKMDFPLKQWIQEMQKGMTDYYQNETDQSLAAYARSKAQYQEKAFQLYEKLLAPLAPFKSKLIIIPDGNLWYLAFEALLTQQYTGDFRNAPYLLNNHSLSYQYAINLWLDGKQNSKNKNKVLAVAPVFKSKQKSDKNIPFENLKFNQKEVQTIHQITNADLLLGELALKSEFLAKANNYAILHLATHAQLNNDNNEFSFLAFAPFGKDTADWKLYVNELYNLDLGAKLVVLSACEAGTGDWQRGEGLTSLGRGFIYAGAKNIVSTLWKVNDMSTANIMRTFYEKLKKGNAIDLSLQQSKLAYIKAQKEDRLASPFYWAAFTTLGNTGGIAFDRNYQQYISIFVGILLMFLGWYIWRRKNS